MSNLISKLTTKASEQDWNRSIIGIKKTKKRKVSREVNSMSLVITKIE